MHNETESQMEADKFDERILNMVQFAIHTISTTESFYPMPTEVAGDVLLGFLWNAKRDKIDKRIAIDLLSTKLKFITTALRRQIFTLPGLSLERGAVLLHLSAAIGVDQVLSMRDLWQAIAAGNFELAHDIILRTYWREGVAQNEASQRRLLALARIWRTDQVPPDPDVN